MGPTISMFCRYKSAIFSLLHLLNPEAQILPDVEPGEKAAMLEDKDVIGGGRRKLALLIRTSRRCLFPNLPGTSPGSIFRSLRAEETHDLAIGKFEIEMAKDQEGIPFSRIGRSRSAGKSVSVRHTPWSDPESIRAHRTPAQRIPRKRIYPIELADHPVESNSDQSMVAMGP